MAVQDIVSTNIGCSVADSNGDLANFRGKEPVQFGKFLCKLLFLYKGRAVGCLAGSVDQCGSKCHTGRLTAFSTVGLRQVFVSF
ncbi:hypothetical protein SDC9_205157 [bioreactor metagenome]|uniref:Uncharacterized protein n=1 Tax=bioreactor metagenome TaxID=1076179 RepID=A0A645JD29_9ZZZZ